jgi:hypothetical protein
MHLSVCELTPTHQRNETRIGADSIAGRRALFNHLSFRQRPHDLSKKRLECRLCTGQVSQRTMQEVARQQCSCLKATMPANSA